MNRTRKNYLYNLTTQIISFLIPVVTTPYISRILGESNVGIFDYIQSVASYFILIGCLGLNSYGQREIAYHQEDVTKKTQIFWELTLIRVIAITAVSCVYIISVINLFDNKIYYLLFGVEILANVFDINWFYMGNEDFRFQFMRNIIVKIAYIISIFAFVKTRTDLGIYIACYASSTLMGNLMLWVGLRKQITGTKRSKLILRRHFKAILIMFLPQLAINIYTQLNKTMLGVLTGYEYEVVAFFTQADKIIKLVLTVVTSLGAVMLTKISSAIANEGPEKGQEYLRRSYHFMSLLAWPMACGLFVISDSFVVWFFGDGYMPVSNCLKILSLSIIFITTSNALGMQYLIPTNRMREYNTSIFVGLITNVILNFILIPKMKEVGACISNIISEFTVMLIQVLFLKKDLSYRKMFLSADMLKIMISSLLMSGIIKLLMYHIPGGFMGIIISVLTGIVVYGVFLCISGESIIIGSLTEIISRKDR